MMLGRAVSTERNAMPSFRTRAVRLRIRLIDLISSNLFTVLLLVIVLAGATAKLLSPEALQTQQMDAEDGSASITISNRSDCLHLKFDNATAGVTSSGMTPCPDGESRSENRFSAISNAFQHK
jgi:hypothetical protein